MAAQQKKSREQIEKEFFEQGRPASLLKRFVSIDEVAALVTYVAGEPSSATNGAARGRQRGPRYPVIPNH